MQDGNDRVASLAEVKRTRIVVPARINPAKYTNLHGSSGRQQDTDRDLRPELGTTLAEDSVCEWHRIVARASAANLNVARTVRRGRARTRARAPNKPYTCGRLVKSANAW